MTEVLVLVWLGLLCLSPLFLWWAASSEPDFDEQHRRTMRALDELHDECQRLNRTGPYAK